MTPGNKTMKLLSLCIIFFVWALQAPYSKAASTQLNSPANVNASMFFWRSRVPRSPFMPPTVTSYQPPISLHFRKSGRNKKVENLERIARIRDSANPPMISSSRVVPSASETKQLEQSTSNGMNKRAKAERLNHPMAILFRRNEASSEEIAEDLIHEGVSIVPQNDQYSSAAEEDGGYESLDNNNVNDEVEERAKEDLTLRKPLPRPVPAANDLQLYYDFNTILDAIGSSAEELQDLLRKRGLSLDDYLGFIKRGVTQIEVKKYLGFLNFSKGNEEASRSNHNGVTRQDVKLSKKVPNSNRQKLFEDLPFTEIVHEVPISRRKSLSSITQTTSFDNQFVTENYPLKNNGRLKAKKYKKNKMKYRKPMTDHFLMTSNTSMMPPPNDSPIITSFLPPKKKNKTKKGSASIISLTIEKNILNKTKMDSSSVSDQLPIRNKVLVNSEADKWPPKSEKIGDQEKQDNLRLVFPMRGILLFCGVLGAVAFITIIIIIIYGAVKCNRKPLSNSYQLNEHIEIPSS